MSALALKQRIVAALRERVEAELEVLNCIARQSRHEATHDDMKSEGKYDTRAIEAGYLAGAQKRRAIELEAERDLIDSMLLRERNTRIEAGALARLAPEDEDEGWYFVANVPGGAVSLDGSDYRVISIRSPIGREALGLEAGEVFEVETPRGAVEYEVVEIT